MPNFFYARFFTGSSYLNTMVWLGNTDSVACEKQK